MVKDNNTSISICILRLSSIGDVTHIIPIISTIRNVYPKSRISWVFGKTEYELVKNLKNIDFTFLDGGHSYQTVISDLSILYENMKDQKKVILCDDYGKESYISEVEKAINDFTKKNNLTLNLIENRFAEIIT